MCAIKALTCTCPPVFNCRSPSSEACASFLRTRLVTRLSSCLERGSVVGLARTPAMDLTGGSLVVQTWSLKSASWKGELCNSHCHYSLAVYLPLLVPNSYHRWLSCFLEQSELLMVQESVCCCPCYVLHHMGKNDLGSCRYDQHNIPCRSFCYRWWAGGVDRGRGGISDTSGPHLQWCGVLALLLPWSWGLDSVLPFLLCVPLNLVWCLMASQLVPSFSSYWAFQSSRIQCSCPLGALPTQIG